MTEKMKVKVVLNNDSEYYSDDIEMIHAEEFITGLDSSVGIVFIFPAKEVKRIEKLPQSKLPHERSPNPSRRDAKSTAS